MQKSSLTILVGLIALSTLGAPAHAGEGADPDRARSEGLAVAYRGAAQWPVKALALTSLGKRWHPVASPAVLDALSGKDTRLRVYGLAALRQMQSADLRVVLTPELVEHLATKRVKDRHPVIREQTHALLVRAFPASGVDRAARWPSWWRKQAESYAPAAWEERGVEVPEAEPGGHNTVETRSIVERALDLTQTGLELVIVLDTTGSMQLTIDATRNGLMDLVELLGGMAPSLEVGLVQYRERGDIGGSRGPGVGADVVSALTRNVRKIEGALGSIQAYGGGDIPERVEAGLWHALQKQMGWSKDTNKMIVIIGDAPPHPNTMKALVEAARLAHEHPAGEFERRRGERPPVVTGEEGGADEDDRVRPFVISCVGVGPMGAAPITRDAFKKIAEAGGGVYANLRTKGPARVASTALVSRIIELSFGEKYVQSARRFVKIFFEYADAGYPMR